LGFYVALGFCGWQVIGYCVFTVMYHTGNDGFIDITV
jgi:hypothetical protein